MIEPADCSILAIDDSDIILGVIKSELGAKGYKVTTAINSNAAKNLILLAKYDLILLDLEMPEMTGMEFLELIRSQGDNTETPVIMLTADNDPERVKECLSNGAKDYILKPFNSEIIHQRIQSILS